jgi:hypothetical protein
MGLQIPRGVHSQIPQEGAVWGAETVAGRCVPQVGFAEGSRIEKGHLMLFVSTEGRDEAVIREYIKNQEQEDKRNSTVALIAAFRRLKQLEPR